MNYWRQIKVVLTVAIAMTTLGGDALFGQGRQPAADLRIAFIDGREVVDGEVIVRYRAQTGQVEQQRAEYQVDSDISDAIGRRGARRVRSRQLTTQQMLARLRANPDVEYAEPNYVIRATATPNDPSLGQLWGLVNSGQVVDGQAGVPGADIGAAAAWDITTGSRATVVAIIDTGIDFSHEDVAANIFTAPRAYSVTVGSNTISCAAGTHGYDATTNTCIPADDNGHGTHVAGIIGAVGNNNIGVTGVNWTANLMALKVLRANGLGSTADAVTAIEFAIKAKAALGADANIRVLNASWGGANFSQALSDEIEAANGADMLFVAAAGSDGTNNDVAPHYPSTYAGNNVVSVAAVDNTGVLAPYSNYGANSVDLAAPGTAILSTITNNQYGYMTGTSMAAPFVAGAAALVLSSCPLDTATLKSALLSSVTPVASLSGKTVSGGRLDVNAALRTCVTGHATISVTNTTVAPGAPIEAMTTNDLPRPRDWVALYPLGANDSAFLDWTYLNNTKSPPASATGNATITLPAPSTPGSYQLRFFTNGYTRLATSATITVGVAPTLAINDIAVTEGDSGTTTATFTVTLSRASSQTVSVAYATANGTATAGSDYTAASGTLTFPPSTLTRQISVTVNGDTNSEPTETFTVNLSSPINATIADAQGIGSITTDDGAPSPSLAATPTVAPGGTISATVSNGPGTARDWIALYTPGAADGAFLDWWYLNGQKSAPVTGQSNVTVQVPAPTALGNYQLRLFTNGYTLLGTANVTVATGPSLSINDVSVMEGNSGTSTATFTVTLSSASSQTVTVAYATVNGSATAGSDFVAASGTLTFAPGTVTQVIAVTINGDTTAESSETFTIALSTATNAAIADGSGLGTIVTDDTPPSPSLSVASTSVAPGAAINATVNNATGNARDWIAVYTPGAADSAFVDWYYLNGQKTAPASGSTGNVAVQIPAPTTVGNYELRLFTNGYNKLATSPTIAVTNSSSSSSASLTVNTPTVSRGGMIEVVVSNGPGLPRDWLGIYTPSSGDGSFQDWVYLNGQKTAPASGMSSVTVQFPAPTVAGTYELRFFTNGYTKLATSGTITVSP